MIDNAMHRLLCEAADQAGWDEETMMLHTTRFLSRLACDNPDVEQRFQDYLNEEVAFEVLTAIDLGQPSNPCVRYAASLGSGHHEEGDDG